jgi:ribose/xylose/arabinose/galactoside ABC-type transport system permease subunit
VAGMLLGVMIQGVIETYISFDGRLNSWWVKIVTGILLFGAIALQKFLSSYQNIFNLTQTFKASMRGYLSKSLQVDSKT